MADQVGLVLVLVILILAFGLTTQNFLTKEQFRSMANQIPAMVVVTVGMTYVLVIAGIDLSVGSVLALCGVVMGTLMTAKHPMPLWVAAIAALGMGLACGAFNGLVTVVWSIPSFVVTLGMLEIARGAAHWLSGSTTAYITGGRASPIANTLFLGLQMPFWIAVVTVIVAQLVLSRTVFGRYIIAIGTNEEAVRLSGIRTWPLKVSVFMIAGFLSGLGALIEVSRNEYSSPNAGDGWELAAIAAAVIGGTSLMGGRGSVISSTLGVAIMTVLSAGLAARGVSDEKKRVITGSVIILAVILDYYRNRLGSSQK